MADSGYSGLSLNLSADLLTLVKGDFSGGNGDLRKLIKVENPSPISQKQLVVVETPPPESPQTKLRRGRKRAGEVNEYSVILEPEKNPEWLPKGWIIEKRTRPAGKSAGATDTYYHEPVNKKQFRSKKHVVAYLEHMKAVQESSNKKLKINEDNKALTTPLMITQPNFNFESNPEKVIWAFENSNRFHPFIGQERVSDQIKTQWAAMFNPLVQNNGGVYRP